MALKLKHVSIIMPVMAMLMSYGVSSAQQSGDVAPSSVPAVQELDVEIFSTSKSQTLPVLNETIQQDRNNIWQGKDVALSGRDVVSYHTNDAPLEGSKKYAAIWDNSKWQFSSEKNRDLFLQNPEKYVPEFGGLCPVALAENKAKIGHVNQYSIVDEKLYFNFDEQASSQFSKNPDNFLVRAQLNF